MSEQMENLKTNRLVERARRDLELAEIGIDPAEVVDADAELRRYAVVQQALESLDTTLERCSLAGLPTAQILKLDCDQVGWFGRLKCPSYRMLRSELENRGLRPFIETTRFHYLVSGIGVVTDKHLSVRLP